MEDDIDIEEHDVMDNPKIRDIFPDLSLVKIEVPDTIEDTEDQYNVPMEYKSDTHYELNIKKENPNDEEMNTVDNGQSEQIDNLTCQPGQIDHSNELEQNGVNNPEVANDDNYEFVENDNYYEFEEGEDFDYNNRIIIGSKPVPDYDTLYEEALHSNVSVSLENWEDRLKNSLCYCSDCEILFPTVNALDSHKSISHSFLVALDMPRSNTARKSTTIKSSRYCNHCDKIFTDDTALIKHLYELLPLNNFRKPTPEPLKVDANSTRYKCTKCKTYFATFAAGREHKKKFHPTLSNVNIICKVLAKTESGDPVPNPFVAKKEFLASNSLIPKSVLFQCHICQINFVSCYSATQHSIKCRNSTEYIKCTICKRKIRAKDSHLHALQHRYALPGAKLKIYTLHKKMSEKVYIKCPKCSICFDEKKFWVHYGLCNSEKVNFVRCHICQIDICQSRYPNHKSKHVLQKCMKNDFVIVKFYDVNETNSPETLKPANFVPNMPNHGMKAVKPEKIPLYYCNVCGSCKTVPSHRGHKNGACKNLSVHFCELCGLGFSREYYKKHRSHHLQRRLTLNDFKIINLKTEAEMEVPVSNFHCCKRCKIHFLSRDKAQLHNCKAEPFEFCEICNKKFNRRAFAPHSNFHTHSNIPELLEKYNSINDMWNVVYSCTACDLVTMTYDSAVEHSQNHINGLPKPPSKRCDVCDFDIIEPHFKTHTKLHTNKMMIDRTKFRILTFNYEQLFSNEWMTMFSSLPKAHKYQILSKSIYRFSRRFKLNSIINSRSDDIKIFCERCKTAVNFEDTKKHYFDIKCKISYSYVCKTCHLHFSTLHDCLLHENNHDTVPKAYKVLTFKDQKDEQFDQRLKDFELSINTRAPIKTNVSTKSIKALMKSGSQMKSSKTLIKSLPVKSLPKTLVNRIVKYSRRRTTVADEVLNSNRIKLYKCEKCGSCVSKRQNISKHNCTQASRHKMCAMCKENFYFRHIHLHMELHRQFPHLKKKPLVVRFKPHSGTITLPIANIFRCECGLHFTSKQSIESHLEICSSGLDISKETCSKCNLLFPTDALVTHLCKHHSKQMDIRVHLVKNKKSGPLKCADCSIVYPNINNYAEHLFTCGGKAGKTCSHCKLKVETTSFALHRCTGNQKVPVVNKSASISTVFRCMSCDLSYLNAKSLGYHLEKNHVTYRDIVTCDVCKLKFTSTSHSRHEVMHKNSENYIIKVLDPTTGRYTICKGKNSKVLKSAIQSTVDDEDNLEEAALKDTAMEEDKNGEVDQKVESTSFALHRCTGNQKVPVVNKSASISTVFRCMACDLCYLNAKSLGYHLEKNHVTFRDIVTCDVCKLKFTSTSHSRHELMHKKSENYTIKVLDPTTGRYTICKGKNSKVLKSAIQSTMDDEDDLEEAALKETAMDKDKNEEVDQKVESTSFALHRCTDNQKVPVVNKSASISTVFRCMACDLCYLNAKSLGYHLEKNHVTFRDIVTCDVCKLKFTSTSHSRHEVMHKKSENYIIKVLDPTTGRYTICKGKNSKVLKSAIQSTVDDEDDLDEAALEETAMDEDKNEEDDQNDTKVDEFDNVKKAVYRVYKCKQCDACYKLKKRLDRHLAANHVNDLEVVPCTVCGLKFSPKLIQRHMLLHENGDSEYHIEILDYETGAKTVLRGKNVIPSTSRSTPSTSRSTPSSSAPSVKRSYSDYCALRSKRIRNNTNYYNMQNMTDDNFDSQDEEPSTSKYGFESIDMNVDDNESMLTDADNESNINGMNASNDPLNSTDSILPDIETGTTSKTELAKLVTYRLKNTLDINLRNYSTKLYKCRYCNLHFLKEVSITWHLTRNHNRTFIPYNCDICGLGFTYATLKRHIYIHHTCMKLERDSFDIQIFDDNTLKNPPQVMLAADAGHILPDDNITEQIIPPIADQNNVENETNNAKIHYYKCANCNVCFIDENTCRKHCIDHKELNPKTYIECKICNFQFLIDSLKKHVTVHHVEEFFIEDLVITEYTAAIEGNPRVEVYQGIDKVQSRLVSTTTDVSSTEKDIIGI